MNRRSAIVSSHAARRWRLRPVVLSMACMGLGAALAQTLPVGPTIMGGTFGNLVGGAFPTASMNNGGGQRMQIDQTSMRGIIHWQTFSIGARDHVNVNQAMGARSVLLNRVVGSGGPLEKSVVNGTLTANGRVFVVNPAGIVFGAGSQVNVGGLIASTLDVAGANETERNTAFMNGGETLRLSGPADVVPDPASGRGIVEVKPTATIIANGESGRGGVVGLIGAQVINGGSINAPQGSVGLVAGNQVVIDPVGDGLTTFRFPLETEAALQPANLAENARVQNLVGASIQADGGRIALLASSRNPGDVVVNQQGLLQAKSLEMRNGEIVLSGLGHSSTLNAVQVAGTLDASAMPGSGAAGGHVLVEGDVIDVGAAALRAGASGAGANGSVTLHAKTDVGIHADNAPPPDFSGSWVKAKAVSDALDGGADVTVTSDAERLAERGGEGVVFFADTQVLKNSAGDARLTVNSARHIRMEEGSAIQSSAGALHVDFNADSKGSAEHDSISSEGASSRGAILLNGATIESNGGDIRLYGQSDAANGRAVGGRVSELDGELITQRTTAGIEMRFSTVSTCGASQTSCAGAGSIRMRAEGVTLNETSGTPPHEVLVGTEGVLLLGSTLRTGSGAIDVRGEGGIGAAGVLMGGLFDATILDAVYPRITSSSGNIQIIGRSRDWVSGDPVGDVASRSGDGVSIANSVITTGGNVRIEGTGGDIAALATNVEYLRNAAVMLGSGGGNYSDESVGVNLSGVEIQAGRGRSIDLVGESGSPAFWTSTDATTGLTTSDFRYGAAHAVRVSAANIRAEGGRIGIDGGTGNVALDGQGSPLGGAEESLLISTASQTGPGGQINVRGRNVLVEGYSGEGVEYARLDSSGAGQAGIIDVRAIAEEGVAESGVLAIDYTATLAADAVGSGNGGTIYAVGDRSLRAHGVFEAKGGAAGGNGGFVETSGGAFDLSGVSVDASAPAGRGGEWLIDPYNVEINGFGGAASLPSNPFVPLADSVVSDSSISNALNAGTDVTITTGSGGSPTDGDIFLNGAQIQYTAAAGERTLSLQAHRSVRSNADTTIASFDAGGPLNVVFTADANGGGAATGGGQVSFDGRIYSNGGNVTMTGAWANDSNRGASVGLGQGAVVDTRRGNEMGEGYTGGSDALAGGNVQLTGRSVAPTSTSFIDAAVRMDGARIVTSTGNVDILGTSTMGGGVRVEGFGGDTGIFTTSGNVRITGVGSHAPNSATTPPHGVLIGSDGRSLDATTVQTGSGSIEINGLRLADETATGGDGVRIGNGAFVTSTGGGDIRLTGESLSPDGAGVRFASTIFVTEGSPLPAGRVQGSGNVVLRASNIGTGDALVLGDGSVASAAGVLNLRPGGVDLGGGAEAYVATPVDRIDQAIYLGGAETSGFSVSAADLTHLAAPTLVVGGSTHAADITVQGSIDRGAGNLTLQNTGTSGDAVGAILLEAPVTAAQVGLAASGDVRQTAGAPIVAQTLLARSTTGSVLLDAAPNNVAAATLGGDAAGDFRYQDVDALRVGSVSVTGFDSAGNVPQALSSSALAGQNVFVRTLSGDLSLATNVNSSVGADLVAGARFQNTGSFGFTGAPWRIWADTWVGETRGGLAGSGALPNLFNCAYLGACGVTVTPTDNHFIYRQQPVATVYIDNATRAVGTPNPAFTYTLNGLILGDTTGGISGSTATTADAASAAGNYPITGSFASAAGYAVNVLPGTLAVTEPPPPPIEPKPVLPELRLPEFTSVDWMREDTNTYTFDRNIGPAPMCFATGPLQGDRAQEGEDLLAREWSRVRSRPNLMSCVDTERKNGCGDF